MRLFVLQGKCTLVSFILLFTLVLQIFFWVLGIIYKDILCFTFYFLCVCEYYVEWLKDKAILIDTQVCFQVIRG